ncbi:hypothetical protein JXL83_07105 [candidate division WOR-3 bacterium]|nr:hypothetical protein [candidate division WOR-3 bacterium]
MEQTCELLEKCGFFRKYQDVENEICEMLIAEYCKGSMMNECKRKEYRQKNGVPPSDDMLPDGEML